MGYAKMHAQVRPCSHAGLFCMENRTEIRVSVRNACALRAEILPWERGLNCIRVAARPVLDDEGIE